MTPTRRGFLATLAAAFVAPDADELLWRPGARLISVPAPRRVIQHSYDEETGIRIELVRAYDWKSDTVTTRFELFTREYDASVAAWRAHDDLVRAVMVLPHAPPPQLLKRRRA